MTCRVPGCPLYGRDRKTDNHSSAACQKSNSLTCPPMSTENISQEVPSKTSHIDDLPPSIASPPLPAFLLDEDDDDAQTINTISTHHYARAKSLYHQRRGDSETLNSTKSLYDSDVLYYHIHGRRYCKHYCMPNDDEEQARMQMLNDIFYHLLGERLTTVPLVNPKRILDIGTGIGDWAMAMGDEYPDAEIIGTDIAKIQPTSAPINVFFEIDDAEDESGWAWADDEFDFVHFRYLCGAFASWKHIYQETYKHLKPGGWVEVLDFDDHRPLGGFQAELEVFPTLVSAILEGAERSGRSRVAVHLDPSNLEELGFVDVKSTTIKIPVGMWLEDPQVQKNGRYFLIMILLGMEAVSLRPLTEHMGWTAEAVRECCEGAAQAIWKAAQDPVKSQGLYFKVKILVGRKPGGPEASGDTCCPRPPTCSDSTARGEDLAGNEQMADAESTSGVEGTTGRENTVSQDNMSE